MITKSAIPQASYKNVQARIHAAIEPWKRVGHGDQHGGNDRSEPDAFSQTPVEFDGEDCHS